MSSYSGFMFYLTAHFNYQRPSLLLFLSLCFLSPLFPVDMPLYIRHSLRIALRHMENIHKNMAYVYVCIIIFILYCIILCCIYALYIFYFMLFKKLKVCLLEF